MKLSNPFLLEVRLLFLYITYCWECGSNGQDCGGLELHHIWGRISGSALNAAPLCKCCHDKVTHNQSEHHRLLRKTITFLHTQRYKLVNRDIHFLDMVKTDLRYFSL